MSSKRNQITVLVTEDQQAFVRSLPRDVNVSQILREALDAFREEWEGREVKV